VRHDRPAGGAAPGRLAIALTYEREAGGAPRVVASGSGALGERIIETAKQNGVPIEDNPGLAAALSGVEIGEQIPVELYKAVAEVLIFVLRMSGRLR
jgi:flagellar biosynthesis protein